MLVTILTDPECGGTFLNWTLHYLAGQHTHFNVDQNKNVEVVENPIRNHKGMITAHNFNDNLINRFKYWDFHRIKHNFEVLTPKSVTELQSIHIHWELNDRIDYIVDQLQSLLTHSPTKIIRIAGYNYPLYFFNGRPRAAGYIEENGNYVYDLTKILDRKFRRLDDKKAEWAKHCDITKVYNLREFLAFSISDPEIKPKSFPEINQDFYLLDALTLWTNFNPSSVMAYLGLDVDQSRFANWQKVYDEWKQVHAQKVKFMLNFNIILDNIIAGNDMDLLSYDLDLYQEVAIQHKLIYTHKLNLQCFELEKFENTLQLHKILEKIH